jgi:hypothetical protein
MRAKGASSTRARDLALTISTGSQWGSRVSRERQMVCRDRSAFFHFYWLWLLGRGCQGILCGSQWIAAPSSADLRLFQSNWILFLFLGTLSSGAAR